jgi:hypothetical protein
MKWAINEPFSLSVNIGEFYLATEKQILNR